MRVIGNLIGLAVVLAALAFVGAPFQAFMAIRAAADAGDRAGLERLIDYGQVRRSLAPQLEGRAEAEAPEPGFLEDPIGAVARRLERPAPDVAVRVDAFLTPAALAGLTRGEGRHAEQRSRTPAPPRSGEGDPWPRPLHWGVDRARMSVEDEGGARTVFTFERRGIYAWKLVHVGLPAGAAPTPAAAPVPRVGDNLGKKRAAG